ncbi:four helix bundle protein [Flavobacterium sp. I3-2]|uniref:four helix bundle protein n=1 Tax=Flavobacterium sp. I3-2 TaxID=2748319 RepID=UPI0015AA9945|nr:four helix bundle protein [Flavobacterium sp. I3-2]
MMHTDLQVYQKSLDFVISIYQITADFPSEEKYGLTSQLRRAAVSIPTNIAEGVSKNSTKEYIRFLYISLGSISEIECLLEISNRLTYCTSTSILTQNLTLIKKMLIKLIASLRKRE